jgi:methanogenic corrinoid protein MtbC1
MTTTQTLTAAERLHDAMVTGCCLTARSLVGELLDQGASGASLIVDLLVPAQTGVGDRWERGEWTVADEHAATAVADSALAVIESNPSAPRGDGVQLAAACAETEWHSLPARMAAQLLREGGAQVRFLGPSMPADHLREYLARLQPDALILSATMPTSLPGAARSIEAAHDAGVPVIAGGRAFGNDATLATRLGAAGWLGDARALDSSCMPQWEKWAPPQLPWSAFLTMEHQAETVTGLAYEALLVSAPSLRSMTPGQSARTREDLNHIQSFLAVSVLLHDDRVIRDFTAWLLIVLSARGVPTAAAQTSYRALSDQLAGEPAEWLTTLADEMSPP